MPWLHKHIQQAAGCAQHNGYRYQTVHGLCQQTHRTKGSESLMKSILGTFVAYMVDSPE